MITENQLAEIRNYLSEKELPLNIMMEVYDHFVQQILDFVEKGSDFNNAFYETKLLWSEELREINPWNLSGRKMTQIVKQSEKKWSMKAALLAVLLSICAVVLISLLAKLFSLSNFKFGIILLYLLMVLTTSVFYFRHRDKYKLAGKLKKKLFINHYQEGMRILVVSVLFLLYHFFYDFHKNIGYVYYFIDAYENKHGWPILGQYFIGFFVFFLGCLAHQKFIKDFDKSRNFIKFFHES